MNYDIGSLVFEYLDNDDIMKIIEANVFNRDLCYDYMMKININRNINIYHVQCRVMYVGWQSQYSMVCMTKEYMEENIKCAIKSSCFYEKTRICQRLQEMENKDICLSYKITKYDMDYINYSVNGFVIDNIYYDRRTVLNDGNGAFIWCEISTHIKNKFKFTDKCELKQSSKEELEKVDIEIDYDFFERCDKFCDDKDLISYIISP
jgi:hypothetical protein